MLGFQIRVLEDEEDEAVDEDLEDVLRCSLRLALRVRPEDLAQVRPRVFNDLKFRGWRHALVVKPSADLRQVARQDVSAVVDHLCSGCGRLLEYDLWRLDLAVAVGLVGARRAGPTRCLLLAGSWTPALASIRRGWLLPG